MLALLSPSKTLDLGGINIKKHTIPYYIQQANYLAEYLSTFSMHELGRLMSISSNLAKQNTERFKNYNKTPNLNNSKQAIFTYKGDVYNMMDVKNYSDEELDFAQKHLNIISGLYGILRPLDLIQPYRLEMAINLATDQGRNLYEFWASKITSYIKNHVTKDQVIINLASQEYSKAIDRKLLANKWVDITFKEKYKDNYKVIGLLAKRARGMMANFIIKNQITDYHLLKDFNEGNYQFNSEFSSTQEYVFTRGT